MTQELLLTALAAVFTLISPVVIQWRKTPKWSTLRKVGLPVFASLVISIAYLLASGGLDGRNLLEAFLIIYGLQQLVYSTIVKNIESLRTANWPIEEAPADDPYERVNRDPEYADRAPIPGTTLDLGATEADPERYE